MDTRGITLSAGFPIKLKSLRGLSVFSETWSILSKFLGSLTCGTQAEEEEWMRRRVLNA
jgi:hypothetical protein